jgi:hypothetical protein
VLFGDSRGGVEEEWQFDAVGVGGCHGAVVALLVEGADFVFLCEGGADAEGAVEGGLVAALCAFGSVVHDNKNIGSNFIGCYAFAILKNI